MITATPTTQIKVAMAVVTQLDPTLSREEIADKAIRGDFKKVKGGKVNAYINHGRWVADCPCRGAELVVPGEPMLCGSCGAEHQVVFPPKAKEAVALLARRPLDNQNWNAHQGETVTDLLGENIAAGLET